MRNIFTLLMLFAISVQSFGQVPYMMKYQAIVRNNDGMVLNDQNVAFRFSVVRGSESGTAVYVEEHNGQTNSNGLISLTIGDGTSSDDFTSIDWGSNDYFLKVELDSDGGSSYQEMGVSQILSVPYAIYAQNIPNNSVNADKISDNSINSAKVEDGSLSSVDLAANSIESNHIVDGSVTKDDVAENSIDSTKIIDGSISSDDLAGNISTSKFSAYQDLIDDGRLDNNSMNDLLTRTQADTRYLKYCHFSASNTDTKIIQVSGTSKVQFNEENYDLGANYSPSNDRFVAPLNGIYQFSVGLDVQDITSDAQAYIGFMVNNAIKHWVDFHEGNGILNGSKELYLNTDDYVEVVVWTQDADYTLVESATNKHSYFTGYLVKKYTPLIIIF